MMVPRLAGRLALLLAMGILLIAGWRSLGGRQVSPGTDARSATTCTCEEARAGNGWCEACERGYVAAREIRSRMLFEALDAHGHDLDPAIMSCTTCRRLREEGGFCESCRFGWVDGQAYMSRLTFHLARGRPRALSCAACRDPERPAGWCDSCARGWTGNVSFSDPDDYRDAKREFARLEAAIEASSRCETCALVLLVDGKCPYCGITYRDGEATPGPP